MIKRIARGRHTGAGRRTAARGAAGPQEHERRAAAPWAPLVALPVLAVLTVALVAAAGSLPALMSSAAELSARMALPCGGTAVVYEKLQQLSGILAGQEETKSGKAGGVSLASSSGTASKGSSASVSTVSSAASSAPVGRLPVRTVTLGPTNSSQYVQSGNIWVYNETASHSADIQQQLGIRPDVHINLSKGPQVLIVHTHTTESFADSDTGSYDPNYPTRNADKSKSVVAIGDKIAQALQQNGIQVVHDTTYHDYPSYSNAYAKSLATVEKDLKQYPTIQVVLDIHRDAIQYSNGTRVKPTVEVAGKKAAQIMVVSACDEAGTALSVPDWQYNYRFALRIQQQIAGDYPNLARPLDLCPRRYNMQVSHGALLVEFGTDVNTLDEVLYSGRLFGSELSKVLLNLQG